MTYNPNIPQDTDLISDSQSQLLVNFGQANTIFSADHYAFDDATTGLRGLQRKSSYVAQGSNPSNLSGIDQVFAKVVNYGGSINNTELFIKNASNNSSNGNAVIQLTNSVYLARAFTTAATGNACVTNLPGGLLFIGYNRTNAYGTSGTIDFLDAEFSFLTACVGLSVTPITVATPVSFAITAISPNSFDFVSNVALTGITYTAIGY